MMDYYGDFGVTGAPQAAVSPEVQAYIDRLKAYEQQQIAAGRLVRPSSSMGTDYASLMAQNVNPESYYQTGYQFLTNAGKKAKAKANPSAQIFYDPNKTYVFENERKNNKGTDYRTFDVTDQAGFDRMYAEAQRLSQTQGKKANWRVFEVDPATGKRTVVADDDPKGPLGKIADFALPVLGAVLAPVTGGLSAAAAAGLGAAGGSALSGALQGKSIGNILKGAALSGAGAFAGGSLLNGLGAGASGASGASTGAATSAAQGAVQGGLSGLGSAAFDGITVLGSNALSGLGAVGAGLGGGFGSVASSGGGGYDGGDIVVEGQKPTIPDWGPLLPVGAVGAGAALGGPNSLGGQLAEEAAQGEGGLSSDKIVSALRAAGLLTGVIGDLFGGGGKAGDRGTYSPGQLNPVFSKELPTSSFISTNRTPRDMPAQDWNQYGMRPEQSFWSDVPQRYTPPPMGGGGGAAPGPNYPVPSTARFKLHGFAEGGRADDQIARVSEGEYIIDAETVALLGDGSNEAGAKRLDDFRVNLRKDKGRKLAKGAISPDAKAPEAYMKGRK